MPDGDDEDTVYGEAAAFIPNSTSVCQISESLTRRSGALQYVFSPQKAGFIGKFNYLAHQKKWVRTLPV